MGQQLQRNGARAGAVAIGPSGMQLIGRRVTCWQGQVTYS
jgi:hypothetical protein